MKRFISCLLSLTLLASILPLGVLRVMAADLQPYVIEDGYVQVQVSKKNAGFLVNTIEGDLLKKSDNNKKLLFHNDEFDTSFVSYQVDYGGARVEEYIFGGRYGDSSDPSHKGVTIVQESPNGPVLASWSVGDLTFFQSLSLENKESSQHGMVSIQLASQNNGSSPVSIKARLLLDTSLGDQDYACYQVVKDASTETITAEKIIQGATIPMNFYAMDNPFDPEVLAYSVNKSEDMPYQVAFGHWNNLAASLFDFSPDTSLNYTNPYNDYLTADSAYALYYDLGSVAAGGGLESLISYYGVYSRHNVSTANSVAVDVVAPLRLALNDEKDGYKSLVDVGVADFVAGVSFENYASDRAQPLKNVALAIQTTSNLRVLDDSGQVMAGYDYDSYKSLNISYADVQVGKPINKEIYFQARASDQAAYERITIGVYDVSATSGELSTDKLLGEKVIYILLPGSDGDVPKVNFASMTPNIVYASGTRHLFVTVTNATLLTDRANWQFKAYSHDKKQSLEIAHNLITINDGVLDLALTDEIKLAPGSWFLQLEWTDAAVSAGLVPAKDQKQTGPQLNFVVSEDPKYRNDSYGILSVVEYNNKKGSEVRNEVFTGPPAYRLESFVSEEDFNEFKDKGDYEEILLIFRGEFTADKYVSYSGKDGKDTKEYTYYSAVSTKTLDPSTREYEVDNTISINGAMDFEGGSMLVYYEDYKTPDGFKTSSINVEFDGELLTSNARTSIWTGKSILTQISQGESFSLRPYDENGERTENFNDNTIRLVWPSIYGAGQTLAGMVFKLAYGELGVMQDDDGDEIGRVLSFSASLSLNFLKAVPGDPYDDPKITYWSKIQDIYRFYDTSQDLRAHLYSQDHANKLFDFEDVDEEEPEKKGVSAAVMVEDILFGCGQGFIGFHFKVAIGVQNMIDSLPEISGELEVNTINDWSFGFEGSMELPTMQMEARLKFKSHNDIPVPDEIYFYVGGFKPGINIDGGGVVWITGGGGGLSNIYDTIFMTQSVPPLKLLISVSFSIIQVMDGRADISLGLTGISLEAKDLKILGALKAIESISLGLEWYPDFDLQASISVDFFEGVIKGGGYIVLFSEGYQDFFFEIYIYAILGVPKSVPVVGGMTLLGVDLGANNDKIWGGFKILGIGYGVTYYWGQDGVDFTSGDQMAQPTFPNLMSHDDIPIYYDEDRGQTLYASFGTNISPIGPAQVLESSDLPRLMAAGLWTDPDDNLHKFNLGVQDSNNNAAIVQISYAAADEEDAQTKANAFQVKSNADMSGDTLTLYFYDQTKPDTDPVNQVANANVSYDEAKGQAVCSFTVTDELDYNKDWYISTGEVTSTVMLYNVGLLPELTSVNGTVDVGANKINLTWDGANLAGLDKISFYLTESNDKGDPNNLAAAEAGRALTVLDKSADIISKSATLDLPADLPTGDYYIRAVYSKEDQVNGLLFSENTISYTNINMPGTAMINNFAPAGNLEYSLTIGDPADDKTDGYLVTIYDNNGPSDVAGLTYDRASSGATTFNIGGSYQYEDEAGVLQTHGLAGGHTYYAGVTPYKLLDTDNNGENDSILYGQEVMSNWLTLPVPTKPTVTITADQTEQKGTFKDKNIDFTAIISEAVIGQWVLDDTQIIGPKSELVDSRGTFTNTSSVDIVLADLAEGDHILTLTGANGQGDRFKHDYTFRVDTTPPRLLLASPVNGSLFNKNGSLTIKGITDPDALFSLIYADGSKIVDKKTVSQLAGTIAADGTFEFTVNIPNPHSASRHELTIAAADEWGNSLAKDVWVTHGGLADLEGLEILVNGASMADGSIPEDLLGGQQSLALAGITSEGQSFRISDDSTISWQSLVTDGSAEIDDYGNVTLSNDATGILIGMLEVATGAHRTAVLSFGPETNEGMVKVTASAGGQVSGGGQYSPGQLVTIKATANSGYTFAGWTIDGVTVDNTGLSTITFMMPRGTNVTAHAEFRPTSSDDDDEDYLYDPDTVIVTKTAETGELVETSIPTGVNSSSFVAYYINSDGSRTFVALSAPINGKLYFQAPADATYYFVDNRIAFKDTIDHWAATVINFMTARGLLKGVGDNQFAPNQAMTRGMLVTVLHRLAGEPAARAGGTFTDVDASAWYADAVAWGYENEIVMGMGSGIFAPNVELTRDQMCALIVRFIRLYEIDLPALGGDDLSFTDVGAIPDWAIEDIAYCQALGLIKGYPDGKFQPKGKATRAENSVVLMGLIETLIAEIYK